MSSWWLGTMGCGCAKSSAANNATRPESAHRCRTGTDVRSLLKYRLEILRQARFGVPQDLDNRLAIGQRQRCVFAAVLFAGQDLPHPLIDRRFGLCWEAVESGAVDHITARVSHHAPLEVELSQGTAPGVARSLRRELPGEPRVAFDVSAERPLVHEQQVVGEFPDRIAQHAWRRGRAE